MALCVISSIHSCGFACSSSTTKKRAARRQLPKWVLALARLVGFVSLQEMIQLGQKTVAVNAMHHAGFLNSFAPGRGAAQAVHSNRKKQGRALGCDVQNVADDGFLFNFNSHDNDLL